MLCLALLTVAALQGVDATGVWTGELVANDSQRTNPAHLILKQDGTKLTGSGGPNANEQYNIQNGTASEDGKLSFEIQVNEASMKFALQLKGDSMEGEVTRERGDRKETGKLTVKRTAGHPAAVRNQPLPEVIAKLDADLFAAYNKCDIEKFAGFFPETNVEFYHDKGGLATSKADIVQAVKANICGKVRRELVAGSLEVYPIPGYGAVETGSHRFFNRASGKEEGGDKIAKFLHIWQQSKDSGDWKVTRVVSYAH